MLDIIQLISFEIFLLACSSMSDLFKFTETKAILWVAVADPYVGLARNAQNKMAATVG